MPPKRKRKTASSSSKSTADASTARSTRSSKRLRNTTDDPEPVPEPSNTRKASSRSSSKSSSSSKKKTAPATKPKPKKVVVVTPESIFQEIVDADNPNVADMEGISKLCEKYLGIDPYEDIRVLVLLWKLGSKQKPGQIAKNEWLAGCQELGITNEITLKSVLPSLDTGFLDRSEFKEFYKFCFTFNLQGPHKSMDKEIVSALMKMVLGEGNRIPSDRLQTFTSFVDTQKSYTHITLDQWTSFLDFCYECEDLSTYDDSVSAWPVLIDEYVDYMTELQKDDKKKKETL